MNFVRQVVNGLRELVPNLVFHVLDDLKDLAYGCLQGGFGPLFFGDHLFPVPLVNVNRVEVIEVFVLTNGVHVGVKPFV